MIFAFLESLLELLAGQCAVCHGRLSSCCFMVAESWLHDGEESWVVSWRY